MVRVRASALSRGPLMLEYFYDWMGTAKLYRVVETKNAAGQTVKTEQAINAGADFTVGRYVTNAVQTDLGDKFALSEVGKIVMEYQSFFVRTTAGDPPVTTDTAVAFDPTWYALIGGKKYHIEGVDDVGAQGEILVLTYRRERG